MKLEDLDSIRQLAETVNFSSDLLKRLSMAQPRLVIGHGRDTVEISLPPSMVTLLTETINETLNETIRETEAELTALGVDFSAKPVSARPHSAEGGKAERPSEPMRGPVRSTGEADSARTE